MNTTGSLIKYKFIIVRFLKSLFLLNDYNNHTNAETFRRLVLVNTICFFAIAVLLIVGTASFFRETTIVGLLDVSAAILLTGCLIYFRRTGKLRLPINIGIGIMTILYLYLFFTGGAGGTGFLWYYTYPLFTLYIMERKDALAANLILLVPSFIYLIAIWQAAAPQYSQDFTIRFVPSVSCVFLFSYLYEVTRLRTHGQLQDKRLELEKTVEILRQKESELHKAQDHLEARIEDRTRELQQSNQTLKIEIEERKRSEAQRKKLEARLSRAEKMEALGTLAGGVAHDLNNILSGISSYPQLLLMKIPLDSPLRAPLATIQKSGEKAATIVEDLLTLSRRGVAFFETVNLKEIIQDYLRSPEFDRLGSFHPDITYRTRFSEGNYTINGSTVHLSKSIMNLITNAAEAMPAGGCITIRLENVAHRGLQPGRPSAEEQRYAKLSVTDEGTGISPEDLDHIFEPFFTTKKMGRSGTGLGMAVVWGMVQDHNGHIDVQSIPGKGTTFELLFPVVASTPPAKSALPRISPQGSNESLLVVDDVSEQREIATSILQTMGYNVQSVSSGEAALDYLEKTPADLIILDMTMDPGINGLETYRRIKQINPRQRVIIASGYSKSELIREALRLGARAYLKKPYTVASIATAVADALNAAE